MKNIILIIIAVFSINSANSQAKKPTIMIVPSDAWCNKNHFMQSFNNQGSIVKIPNYKKAF